MNSLPYSRFPILAILILATASACRASSQGALLPGPQNETSVPANGFYSPTQATDGRAIFSEVCGECHGFNEFRGQKFEFDWRRRNAWNFFETITGTMPEDMPGSLSDRQYTEVIAFILEMNDYQAGGIELLPTREALSAIALGPGAAKQPIQDGGTNDR